MIPNHKQFIEAIHAKKKVCVRFYSKADSGVLDRVCAPMDYGPGGEIKDGLNRYWLWDYASNTGPHTLGLVPQQIVDLQVLGEVFDPAQLDVRPPQWSIPRDWGSPPQPMDAPVRAPALFTVAARTVGGQAQRPETIPANKK
ncbi:MAG: hypothetical protein ABSB84_14705 [Verrucomicrobiota bacterium]|jgi:hypothetical protein